MGGGVCDVPSAFALLVFLARSFRVFFARLPKKLMDYLGPPSRPPPKNQVIRTLQLLFVAFFLLAMMMWQLLLLLAAVIY